MRRFTIKHPRLVKLSVNLFSGIIIAILFIVCLYYDLSWLSFLLMLFVLLIFTYLPMAVGRWVEMVLQVEKIIGGDK